ncbi:MAG: type II restriction endonuclease [Terriglobia bacterium]
MKCCESEYQLFRRAERQICQGQIVRLFRDIDDFLQTASSIMNRRKSRAGRSLENHVHHLLAQARIAHEMRPPDVDGTPDKVIPNSRAYLDRSYPDDKLFIVGVKTTCKDRWRQVLNEGKRVRRKYILTIQQGISRNQLREMRGSDVTLIVPKPLHKEYPPGVMRILSVERFIGQVKRQLT